MRQSGNLLNVVLVEIPWMTRAAILRAVTEEWDVGFY